MNINTAGLAYQIKVETALVTIAKINFNYKTITSDGLNYAHCAGVIFSFKTNYDTTNVAQISSITVTADVELLSVAKAVDYQ